MIDFPANPAVGQIFNSGVGPIYVWDGVGWDLVTVTTKTARQNNLVVNPAMIVSQENGAAAGSVNAYYPADQWQMIIGGPVCSAQQVASYTPDNSTYRIRKTVTTLKASLAATDVCGLSQPIEGVRTSPLGFGGPTTALQSVLRFGFKGPAGTYSLSLRNGATNRSYLKNFTISAAQANTDTLQVFVIPGDTAGAWVIDTGVNLHLGIFDAVGTTYQGTDGVWQAGNFLGTSANTNQVATNGNVIELFDVGFYPDPEKTGLPPPFIAPIYADELIRCMRYWQYVQGSWLGYAVAGQNAGGRVMYPVLMRTNPTASANAFGNANSGATTIDNVFSNCLRAFAAVSVTGNYETGVATKLSARM